MAENIPCSLIVCAPLINSALDSFNHLQHKAQSRQWGRAGVLLTWPQGCAGRLQVMVGNWRKMRGPEG